MSDAGIERRFQISCEAEEMVARNPIWKQMYGEDGAFAAAAQVAERAYDHRITQASTGDTLWAWQSQQSDGSWAIITFGTVSVKNAKTLIMVHRDRSWLMEMSPLMAQHHKTFGQAIRLARFELAVVEEEPFAATTE